MLGSRVRAPEGVQNEKRESKGSRFVFMPVSASILAVREFGGSLIAHWEPVAGPRQNRDAVYSRHPYFRRTFRPVTIAGVRLVLIPSAAKELFSTPLEQPFHRHPK